MDLDSLPPEAVYFHYFLLSLRASVLPHILHNSWSCFHFPSLTLLPLRSLLPFFPMTAFFSLPSGIETYSLGTLSFLTFFSHLGCIIYCFLADIHLLVSTHYVCPFESELPHSGWNLLVQSICLQSSWCHCSQEMNNIPLWKWTIFLYQFAHCGVSGLFPASGYHKQGNSEHSGTQAPVSWWGIFCVYAQEWYSWDFRYIYF